MKIVLIAILFFVATAWSLSDRRIVALPKTFIELGSALSLEEDAYSADLFLAGEFSLNERFSFSFSTSARVFSFFCEVSKFKQIHGYLFLDDYGLNNSFLGFKYFPLKYFGVSERFKLESFGGNPHEIYNGLETSFLFFYPLNSRLNMGADFKIAKDFEHHNYQKGLELGALFSIQWNFKILQIENFFLFQKRVEPSKNFNLAHSFQNQKDTFSGIKIHLALGLKITPTFLFKTSYEATSGNLFFREQAHLLSFSFQKEF